MIKQKLQSELVFEQMKGSISLEDCERTVREIRLNEIRAYMDYFQGYLFKNGAYLSEERLDEIAIAVKFFFRIEEVREGFDLGLNHIKNAFAQANEQALKIHGK